MSNIIEQHTTTSLRPAAYYYVIIDGAGNIYQQGGGNNTQVGVTLSRFSEVEKLLTQTLDKAESYEKQLVEAGLLVKPLTPEEQVKILTEQVQSLTNMVQVMVSSQVTPTPDPAPVENTQKTSPIDTQPVNSNNSTNTNNSVNSNKTNNQYKK